MGTPAAGLRGPRSPAVGSPGARRRSRRDSDPVAAPRRLPRTAQRSPVGTVYRSGSPLRSPALPARSGSRCRGGASSPRRGGIERTSWTSGSSWVTRSCPTPPRPCGWPRTWRRTAGPRGRRPGRKPGGRGLDRAVPQGRGGEHLRHRHGYQADDVRHAARVLLPHRPERRPAGGAGVAYMRGAPLRASRVVVIDAQNSYSVGLSDSSSGCCAPRAPPSSESP